MNRLQRVLLFSLALVLLPLQGFAAARMVSQLPQQTAALDASAHGCHADSGEAGTDSDKGTTATQRATSSHCGGCCLAVGLLPMLPEPPRTVLHLLYSIAELPMLVAGTDPDTPHKPPRLSLA